MRRTIHSVIAMVTIACGFSCTGSGTGLGANTDGGTTLPVTDSGSDASVPTAEVDAGVTGSVDAGPPAMPGESEAEIAALSATLVERSIESLQKDLADGQVTSRQLVLAYQLRIRTYNPKYNAVINTNDKALDEATLLDQERKAKKLRGPLHGIPIAVKDNILTEGIATTAGTLALEGYLPPYNATLVSNLKQAGAIIIAKTMMTELANFFAVGAPNGWNASKGQSLSPYDPRMDPSQSDGGVQVPLADVSGSSSGVGTTASLWPASVGTETSGSIISPSIRMSLYGLKPTVGRISRHGILPISLDQDTAGPMGRTVKDIALLFGALEGAAPDDNDATTERCKRPANQDYTQFLEKKDLTGVTIGIPRAYVYQPIKIDGQTNYWGPNFFASKILDQVKDVLIARGATIVDNADIPSYASTDSKTNLAYRGACTTQAKGTASANCSNVLRYSQKRDMARWFETLKANPPRVTSLTQLREFNNANKGKAIPYGQAILDASDLQDLTADLATYEADRKKDLDYTETRGLKAAFDTHKVDALLFIDGASVALAAWSQYPNLAMPAGTVTLTNRVRMAFGDPLLPADFVIEPLPWGVTVVAKPCDEPTLFRIAAAYESGAPATLGRVKPKLP